MNNNMPISVDNKLLSSLTPDAKQKILILFGCVCLVKEIAHLAKEVSPEIKLAINRAFDLATAKLALKHGYHPRDISDLYEANAVDELTAA